MAVGGGGNAIGKDGPAETAPVPARFKDFRKFGQGPHSAKSGKCLTADFADNLRWPVQHQETDALLAKYRSDVSYQQIPKFVFVALLIASENCSYRTRLTHIFGVPPPRAKQGNAHEVTNLESRFIRHGDDCRVSSYCGRPSGLQPPGVASPTLVVLTTRSEILGQLHKPPGWRTVADKPHIEIEFRRHLERPPHGRLDPSFVVAKSAAT
jgi:hypothetical protein